MRLTKGFFWTQFCPRRGPMSQWIPSYSRLRALARRVGASKFFLGTLSTLGEKKNTETELFLHSNESVNIIEYFFRQFFRDFDPLILNPNWGRYPKCPNVILVIELRDLRIWISKFFWGIFEASPILKTRTEGPHRSLLEKRKYVYFDLFSTSVYFFWTPGLT